MNTDREIRKDMYFRAAIPDGHYMSGIGLDSIQTNVDFVNCDFHHDCKDVVFVNCTFKDCYMPFTPKTE